tara:strand:- start:719 stop:1165 length:447 start_codon:yes stop_codon:yes gene_type:complete
VIDISILNDYNKNISFNSSSIETIIKKILSKYNISDASISIILSNKTLLNKLKKDYFNLNHFTDVIAFNLEEKGESLDGEVYISIDDVSENSKEYRVDFNDEFKRVIIHGVLHLIGFEDNTKQAKKEMTTLENSYMTFIKEKLIYFNK